MPGLCLRCLGLRTHFPADDVGPCKEALGTWDPDTGMGDLGYALFSWLKKEVGGINFIYL